MYDRLTGGTTIIISSAGTIVPGSPTRPEYLKASVYLPPAFVAHHPDLHNHIIDIVQQYIETVGVRTVTMWTQRARHDLHYSLNQLGNPRRNAYFNAIPIPDHNSAHYTFIGQPYRFTQDPFTVGAPSPDGSVASYDFGEDPDAATLLNIDLQQLNTELQDQISTLEQKISDLEHQVHVGDVRNLSQSSNFKRAQDRIMFLEAQVQRFIADRIKSSPASVSTPVCDVVAHDTPQPTPLRYGRMTPSRTQAQMYRSPRSHTPDTPSKCHSTTSVSRVLKLGNLTAPPSIQASPSTSRTARESAAMDENNADELASAYGSRLPHYINLYHLQHLAAPLDLIFNYTPAGNRTQELLKLGLGGDVSDALAEAMALDNGMGLPCSGKDNIE
jgi:hypothetical protein